ncbi:MAG: double-strand break repair protein AddB [Pseudomonadota bacterium]
MTSPGLFAEGRAKVWTIPAGLDFLDVLAGTLALETGLADDPAALAGGLIYVPNRRSARALALALHRHGGGRTILPPDIRALGDLETDEPPNGTEEALADLGPALPPARRLGALACLVMEFYARRGMALPPGSALAAARELAALLDQAALSGEVDWAQLPNLIAQADLAVHWEESVEFLRIVAEFWPQELAETGASDPFERRACVAEAIADNLRRAPPDGVFIVAGSTGATPASQTLMAVATELKRGLVVLPGLDRGAPGDMWATLGDEPDHPQHSLSRTLARLGLGAGDVAVLPGQAQPQNALARRKLIHESLAPAGQTADWLDRLQAISGEQTPADFAETALEGLSLLEARDEDDEARLAAVSLRAALEIPGATAALVTPDAGLARRVAAHLLRWGVSVPPSAGIPLGRTSAGSALLLALAWARDTGDPVALMALLKHHLAAVDPGDVAALDQYVLRGTRRWTDVADLYARLDAVLADAPASRHRGVSEDVPDRARRALQVVTQAAEDAGVLLEAAEHAHRGADYVDALIALLNTLAGGNMALWAGADGAAVSRCLEAVRDLTDRLPALTAQAFADIVDTMAASISVRDGAGSGHPRLSIWGPLEARLQSADRLILAGLNEGVWPRRPPPDAFLPRQFRTPLGLALPEERLGLAAHDFAQLASAPDVLMLYSARREDAPAVASRWVLRLKTLVQGALQERAELALAPHPDRDPRPWVDALARVDGVDTPGAVMPRPTPPVGARPNRLSVTRINTLQRDPYSIYAERVLGLRKLEALGAPLGPAARGTAIHLAIETFDTWPPRQQTEQGLFELILRCVGLAGQPDHLLAAERGPLQETAAQLYAWWRTRQEKAVERWVEAPGKVEILAAGRPFTLTGTADRVEALADGTLAIVDFKTGAPPTAKAIRAGFEQQLPLQVLMARVGQLGDAPARAVSQLGYVSVRHDFSARSLTQDVLKTDELADAAKIILENLITAYRDPETPYLSVPRVQLKSKYAGDYDRLARRDEWAGDTGDD